MILITRACNFRYIAIQWEKPTTYGDALITGYKVYVNGIVEAVLSADSQSYTFTQGKWCQEYSFQVQVTLLLAFCITADVSKRRECGEGLNVRIFFHYTLFFY